MTWLDVLPKLLDKFPETTVSFYQSSESENPNPRKYLSQDIFSLAVLMYTGANLSQEAKQTARFHTTSRRSFVVKDEEFSWDHFVQSEYFMKSHKPQIVWEKILSHLVESGNFKIETNENPSSLELLGLIVNQRMYDIFPELMSTLGDLSMKVPMTELSCITNPSISPMLDRPMGNLSPLLVLLPIRNRTCLESEDISESDLVFMKTYLEQVLIEPDFDVAYELESVIPNYSGSYVTEVACKSLYDWEESPYSNKYSELGVIQKRSSDVPVGAILDSKGLWQSLQTETCLIHKHDIKIQSLVYRTFLEGFYHCASKKGLTRLVTYFQSIEEQYQLTGKKSQHSGPGICTW